jgi:S-adenosylmethionine-diacylglycerol 3-amino-3-carboxypropyl transferase
MSYLVAGPARITAIDLNKHHIALLQLKLAAASANLGASPFHRLFAAADDPANVALFDRYLAPVLPPSARAYWQERDWLGRRRISAFARGFYAQGLLGRFIGAGHAVARLFGVRPRDILAARTLAEQQAFYEKHLRPVATHRLVRRLTSSPAVLFGLGIPPAQYKALCENGRRAMADVLEERLRKLACGFPLKDNYFAWQAFGRRYDTAANASLPPYLRAEAYPLLAANADRVDVRHMSFTDFLRNEPAGSHDRYVLLDAQDWMSAAMLNDLWREITRTAMPGARVIFRTAGIDTMLPGVVADDVLSQWRYEAEQSLALGRADRSAVYGGFHLYVLKDAARKAAG